MIGERICGARQIGMVDLFSLGITPESRSCLSHYLIPLDSPIFSFSQRGSDTQDMAETQTCQFGSPQFLV